MARSSVSTLDGRLSKFISNRDNLFLADGRCSCERFNSHVPEDDYEIDLSRVPGMTPTPKSSRTQLNSMQSHQPLSPLATNYAVPPTPCAAPRTPMPMGPTLEINNSKIAITTPAFMAGSKTVGAKSSIPFSNFAPSLGQMSEEDKENMVPDDKSSPSTPYFLHAQDLVQKTCPPKAHGPGDKVFLLDEASTPFRQRLLLAKRKSMEFAPKISSPLRRSTGSEGEAC